MTQEEIETINKFIKALKDNIEWNTEKEPIIKLQYIEDELEELDSIILN